MYFDKVRPKLRKLAKAIGGKKLDEVDLCKVSYEGLNFQSSIEKHFDVTDVDERYYMALYKSCLELWVQESKDPILPNPATVVIRKLKKPSGKNRTVCRQPILLSLFESFANRIWQVIYQSINREMEYSVSNYLPGMAVPLYSMERLAKKIDGQDFALCNMDVKSCFDNVNLAHPNFLECLDDGLFKIEQHVGVGASQFLRRLFKDYLYENLVVHGNFKFRKSRTCPEVEIPTNGVLPTGFVLSPALWLTLALPAILATHEGTKDGSILGFDLCGDDLVVVAPAGVSDLVKEKVCKPWFDLARKLDLSFHFFKNYKDERVHFHEKWSFLFENKKEQTVESAWINKFPAYSIPVFHAGTVLVNKSMVETITAIDVDTLEGKLYGALSKRVRDRGANFLPDPVVNALTHHSSLENRLRSVAGAKRLGDQGDESDEKVRFITGAQASVIPFFYTCKDKGTRGAAISKVAGWFIQTPEAGSPPTGTTYTYSSE